jgi:branched-chain amino acid transport system substrate-binding protein
VRQILVASSLALGLALTACAPATVQPPPWQRQPQVDLPPEEPPAESRPVRVGLLVPLTGPAEAIGADMLQAAQMALFDVGENPVELLPRDTRSTPEGAVAAAREVLDQGAELLLGPLFGRSATAVAPIARSRGVRVLTFSNDASVALPGAVYILGYRPEEQVGRVAAFALEQGYRRIAGLGPDNAYGSTAMSALRRAVQGQIGGELGPVQLYPAQPGDLSGLARALTQYDRRREARQAERQRLQALGDPQARAELQRLQERDTLGDPPFDAVLIADGGASLRQMASLLAFYDVDPAQVRYLGTERWQEDPSVFAEPALHGGWFAAPSPSGIAGFQGRFERVFGRRPHELAAIAYDATALAVALSQPVIDYGDEALTNPQGFVGATGIFRLRRDGLIERGFAVVEVRPEGTRVVDEPPRAFTDVLAGGTAPAPAARVN